MGTAGTIMNVAVFGDWQAWAVTGLGSLLLWGRLGRTKVRAYVLSPFLDSFMKDEGFLRVSVEVLLFVGFGTILALGICQPESFTQALGAGFGWTSLVAKQGK